MEQPAPVANPLWVCARPLIREVSTFAHVAWTPFDASEVKPKKPSRRYARDLPGVHTSRIHFPEETIDCADERMLAMNTEGRCCNGRHEIEEVPARCPESAFHL
jgi:hypothetical protein